MGRAPFNEATGSWSTDTPADAAGLARWQLEAAWDAVSDAAIDNPFYRGRLRLPKARTAASFASLPVTTKSEIVADGQAHPPYGQRTTCPPSAIRHVVETSGTSGRGREVYALDAAAERAVFESEAVGFWWAGVRPGSRVLLTLPVGVSAAGLWYLNGLRLLGANVLAAGTYSTERKVELIQRYGADAVVGTPSYLHRLGVACREAGTDPASLGVNSIIVAGEAYSLEWAKSMQTLWGATLFEQYGCTERAFAWACPGGVLEDDALRVLHFPAESAYIEVIDRGSGDHVADGAWGELVVTPLRARSSPLVRFATSDRVQWRAPGACSCGRPVAGISAGGVERFDDMIKIRGTNLWPRSVDALVLEVPGVCDYRATVMVDALGRERVQFRVEPVDTSTEGLESAVANVVRRGFGLSVDVIVLQPGDITSNVPEGFVKVSRWSDVRRESADRALENL